MKELELFSTRLTKDLKRKVVDFCKPKGITIQNFTEYALEKAMLETDFNFSQATVFMEGRLKNVRNQCNKKALELSLELIEFKDKNNYELNEELEKSIKELKDLLNKESLTFQMYLESLSK